MPARHVFVTRSRIDSSSTESKIATILSQPRLGGACSRYSVLRGYGTNRWLPPVTKFRYGLAIVHFPSHTYSRTMMCYTTSTDRKPSRTTILYSPMECLKEANPMKSTLSSLLLILVLVAISSAKELPSAPSSVARPNDSAIEVAARVSAPNSVQIKTVESKTIDKKFISLAVISTGSTFADSYTTLFARQNWLAGKKGVCNVEVQSAYLYGTHPTAGRAYAVASVKSVGSVLAAYYLRKRHSKLWSLPLVANSILSLQGTTQNMIACN